jgi:wobble nucleotide-excising tRNase
VDDYEEALRTLQALEKAVSLADHLREHELAGLAVALEREFEDGEDPAAVAGKVLKDIGNTLLQLENAIAGRKVTIASQRTKVEKLKCLHDVFRRLTNNPAISQVCIEVEEKQGSNTYRIVDQDGVDLSPLLSQGDLNSLALALFFGLSSSATEHCAMGTLMLDDPSQNMGTGHKARCSASVGAV